MSSKLITFWEYLQHNDIKIPIIQRDYAQGRKGKSALRRRFLKSLHDSLSAENKPLKLDFVYGTSRNNASLPLDGQQRLTTLWLLHWFVAYKAGELAVAEKILKKFSYETRISSRKFCNKLCDLSSNNNQNETIASIIENQTWFYSAWKQDPTISAMLCIISGEEEQSADCLEKVFSDFNFSDLWEKLTDTDKCPIRFYTMDIGEMQLTDDLYIKMNARGEPLSPCENFKADLFEYIREKAETENTWKRFLDPQCGIMQKWDNSWTDIFWPQRCTDNSRRWGNRIDEIFFAFINRFWLNYMIENGLPEKEIEKISFYPKTIGGETRYEDELGYNSFSDYVPISVKDFNISSALDQLQKILDNFQKIKFQLPVNPSWDESDKYTFIPKYADCPEEKSEYPIVNISQPDRVIFYAICKFLEYNEVTGCFLDNFKKWMRIVWNIVENSNINTISAMSGAIKLIKELALNSENIIDFLIKPESNNLKSDFAKEQIKEERLKAWMIREQDAEKTVIKAERNEHFKGRIISLLVKSGVEGKGEITPEDIISPDILEKRFDKFINSLENKDTPYSDLGRELLKYGDYKIRPEIKNNNWKFITSKKSLFDMLHNKNEDFYSRFIPIFVDFLDNQNFEKKYGITDWQYYFIKYKSILDNDENGLYAWEGDFCCRNLTGTDMRSNNCCPYVMAAAKDLPYKYDQWSSSRNAFHGYTRFPVIGKEIKLQNQGDSVNLLIKSINNENISTVDWNKECDLIDFLKDKIKKLNEDYPLAKS